MKTHLLLLAIAICDICWCRGARRVEIIDCADIREKSVLVQPSKEIAYQLCKDSNGRAYWQRVPIGKNWRVEPKPVEPIVDPVDPLPLVPELDLPIRFQVYKDANGEFRWRAKAANNKIIASSGEGYKNKVDCLHTIHVLWACGKTAVIESL